MTIKSVARQLLEPCDPAKGQVPSPTVTAEYRALSQAERSRVDLLVTRTRRFSGLRAHRRLPFCVRPFIAMRWGCFNAFGAELAPLAWLTGAFVRDVPPPGQSAIGTGDIHTEPRDAALTEVGTLREFQASTPEAPIALSA